MKKALSLLSYHADVNNIEYNFVGNIHDEIQTEVRQEMAQQYGTLAVDSIEETGRFFELNCPLTGEYKIGDNWAETH